MIAGFIINEAIQRINEPPTVASGTMMIITSIGLAANLLSAWALMKKTDVKDNINLKSAYLHIIGEALGSFGAIIAGYLMLVFDWYIANPIISILVSILVLKSAWGVLEKSIHILMEGTPPTINRTQIIEVLETIDGVTNVHDLHVWTITSGLDSLSCHLLVEDDKEEQEVLQKVINLILEKYKIEHTTIQIEKSYLQHTKFKVSDMIAPLPIINSFHCR